MHFSSSDACSIVIHFLETHRRGMHGNSWYLPSPYRSRRSACKRKNTRKKVKINFIRNFVSKCQSVIVWVCGRLTNKRISARRIFRVVERWEMLIVLISLIYLILFNSCLIHCIEEIYQIRDIFFYLIIKNFKFFSIKFSLYIAQCTHYTNKL